MKKYLVVLPFLLMALFMTSCDKEAELKDTTYTTMAISFEPSHLRRDYRVLFNGNTDNVVSPYKPVKVDIYRKADDKLVFSGEYQPTDTLKLIHPVGSDSLAFYSKDLYKAFSPQIVYSGDESELYDVYLGNEKIGVSAVDISYVSLKDFPIELKIIQKSTSATVFKQELSSSLSTVFTVLQLSSTDFLYVPPVDEPLPAENAFKIRFFYSVTVLSEPVKLSLYITNSVGENTEFFKDVELSPNSISDYIEVPYDFYKDGTNVVNFYYDLTNSKGEKLVDHDVIMIRDDGVNYSFMTYNFDGVSSGYWLPVNSLWIKR